MNRARSPRSRIASHSRMPDADDWLDWPGFEPTDLDDVLPPAPPPPPTIPPCLRAPRPAVIPPRHGTGKRRPPPSR